MTEEQYVTVNLSSGAEYGDSIYYEHGMGIDEDPGMQQVLSDAIPQTESCKVCVTQMQIPLSLVPVGYMELANPTEYTDPVYIPTTIATDGVAGMNKGEHSFGLELTGRVGVTFNPLNATPDKTFGPNDFHQRAKLYNADENPLVNGHYYDTGKIYQEHLAWFKDFGTTEMYRMRVNSRDEFNEIASYPTGNERENADSKIHPFYSEDEILSCLSDAFTGALLINRKPSNANPAILHLGLPEKMAYTPSGETVTSGDLFKNEIKPGNLYIPPRVSFFIDENDCVGFTFSPGFASVTEVINDHVQGEDADVSNASNIVHFTATSTTVAKNITEKASAHPRDSNPDREIPTSVTDCANMRQICRNVIASPIPYYAEEQAHVSLFTPGADIDKIRQSSMGSTITVAGVSRLNVEGTYNYVPEEQVTLDKWWVNNTVNTILSHPDQTFLERFYFTVNTHVANLIPDLPWIPVCVGGDYTVPDMRISDYSAVDGLAGRHIAFALDTTKARMTAELPVISPSWAFGLAGGGNPASISEITYRRLAYMLSLVKYRFVFPTVKSCALNNIHSFVVFLDGETTIGETTSGETTTTESLNSSGEICKSEYFYAPTFNSDLPIATFPFSDEAKMKHLTYFTVDRAYKKSRAQFCDPRYVSKYFKSNWHREVPRGVYVRALYHNAFRANQSVSSYFMNIKQSDVQRFTVQLTFSLKLAYL